MGWQPWNLNPPVPASSGTGRGGCGPLVECGEILQSDFAKGFFMQRLVPVLAVNGESFAIMALKKQCVGERSTTMSRRVVFAHLEKRNDQTASLGDRLAPLTAREIKTCSHTWPFRSDQADNIRSLGCRSPTLPFPTLLVGRVGVPYPLACCQKPYAEIG